MSQDTVTLIANSGIQFYKFEATIDSEINKKSSVKFVERYDTKRRKVWFDEAIYIKKNEVWARKSELVAKKYITKHGLLVEEIDLEEIELVHEDEIHSIGNINQSIKFFKNKWIPIPYFKKNNINQDLFGPTDWTRVQFNQKDETTLEIVLAIDTRTSKEEESDTASPFIHENPNENIFSLCENDDLITSYLDSLFECEWVEDYIKKIIYKGNPELELEKPFLKHIGQYKFFIKLLQSFDGLPEIHLYSDKGRSIDVDLVVDIGNSNTCALLFESPIDSSFDFKKVKKLKIQNLSDPLLSYNDSFSTKLVFKEAVFGEINNELNLNNKFAWPSPVRVGKEAINLINDSNIELSLTREVKSYNSSPKRYLWDENPSDSEWEFLLDDIQSPLKRVYIKGISEQLNSDGSICTDSVFGSKSLFSRQSLMTFVFVEIFSHVISQINSFEFRESHGNIIKSRKLKRIIVSCPTAMIKQEQIALRKAAENAIGITSKYQSKVNNNLDTNFGEDLPEIIPSSKDAMLDMYNIDKRKDWIYDEATSAQLVYLYGLINQKFNKNPDLPFNLFGKLKNKENKTENKTLTIGSIDIGGGTTDLMICSYSYTYNEVTRIKPDPLYWESFSQAGDDLLKEVIQQIIIEGKEISEKDKNCSGVIENYARKNNVNDIAKKLNGFFGLDSNNIGYKERVMRLNFINQIAIPIALKYMENANSNTDKSMTFSELFEDTSPSKELLDYFEKHFKFRFEELVWNISSEKIKFIINSVFENLIKQISKILHAYDCDIVLLSGRPSSFEAIEDLFMKYHPIQPNRLINMNKYWVGRWYPYADNNGFIKDPKTIVTVGSLIALMGGKLNKLDKFKIDTELLKNKLNSNANYIGFVEKSRMTQVLFTPSKNEIEHVVHSFPAKIGFKNVDSVNYPSRNIISLDLCKNKIINFLRNSPSRGSNIEDQAEAYKLKLMNRMPFTITFSREFEKDKEAIKIEDVLDFEDNNVSKSVFNLQVQSLEDEKGYWLDTGEFILNVRQ